MINGDIAESMRTYKVSKHTSRKDKATAVPTDGPKEPEVTFPITSSLVL